MSATITFSSTLRQQYLSHRKQLLSLTVKMAQSMSTPRILPEHLEAFSPNAHPVTSTVRMLGTITAIDGDTATLTSHNNQTVTLILNRDSHLSPQSIYEIVGNVINLQGGAGLGIRVMAATLWPKNEQGRPVDLKAFEAVVNANHRYKEIFYGQSDGANGDGGGYQ